MNPSDQPRLRLITPFQWVVAAIVAAVAIGLLVALVRLPSKAEPVWAFRYPGGLFVGATGLTETFRTTDAFTNVSGWYRRSFRFTFTGTAPSFNYYSSSWFGSSRSLQQNGFFATATNAANELFMKKQEGQVVLVHLSKRPGESNTCIQVTQIRVRRAMSSIPLLTSVAPTVQPHAITTMSSTSGSMTFHSLLFRTNLNAVIQWYSDNLGSAAQPGGVRPAQANLVLAVPLPRMLTNEVDWTYSTSNTLTVIHAEDSGSNSTAVVIGSVTF